MDGVGHGVKLIVLIGLDAPGDELAQPVQCPLIQRFHLPEGQHGVRIKAVQVAQDIPGGVADLQILIGKLLEDGVGAAHIQLIVRGGGPQTQKLRAVFGDQFIRQDGVAQGLVHGSPLPVHGPAVGQD